MLVDDALRATFRHFSTLFLVVALVTVPLHIAHSYAFRDVMAVGRLHPDIERFPEGRRVRGVGRQHLREARIAFAVLLALEVGLVPLLLRAARVVVASDDPAPTVMGAYRGIFTSRGSRVSRPALIGWVAGAAAFAAALTLLVRAAGLVLLEPLGDEHAYAWIGLVDGAALAAGGAFLVGPLAFVTGARAGQGTTAT